MDTVWALGDYPTLAREVLAGLGPRLVDACGVAAGERVLDVGAGPARRRSRRHGPAHESSRST